MAATVKAAANEFVYAAGAVVVKAFVFMADLLDLERRPRCPASPHDR